MKAKLTVNSKGKQRVKVTMKPQEAELLWDLLGSISGGYEDIPLEIKDDLMYPHNKIRVVVDDLYCTLEEENI